MTLLKNRNPARNKSARRPAALFTDEELERVIRACRNLPPARGDYRVDDYVINLLVTVLDFRMQARVLNRALDFFREHAGPKILRHRDLGRHLQRFSEGREGETALAVSLWGYRYWTRAALLRKLFFFFDKQGVRDQESLRDWARSSDYQRDFKGRIPGLGFAVYQWLIMRLGAESVKPDTHVKRFLTLVTGRVFSDAAAVQILCAAARRLRIRPFDLDVRLWEQIRRQSGQRNAEVKHLGRERGKHEG